MNDLISAKAEARRIAFANRKMAHSVEASRAGAKNLLEQLEPYRGRPISGYMPIRTEIDPLPTMLDLSRNGQIGVPVILGEGRPLEFRQWNEKMPMETGPFGARIPISADIVVPDVLIVPLVAFDRQGRRLGYGGGYYDRTLEKLKKVKDVLAIGFAYSGQELSELPQEATDQKLDMIVTEDTVLRF